MDSNDDQDLSNITKGNENCQIGWHMTSVGSAAFARCLHCGDSWLARGSDGKTQTAEEAETEHALSGCKGRVILETKNTIKEQNP
jgi:hypothetical protein